MLASNENKFVYAEVVDKLLLKIESGEFETGGRLPSERELAQMLEVGRGSLREALRVLEQKQVILSRPGGIRYVMAKTQLPLERDPFYEQLQRAAVGDLLEARETLEDAIVELACKRGTQEDLEHIKSTLDALRGSLASDKIGAINYDNLFHLAIANAAHNSVFGSMYTANLSVLETIRDRTFRTPGRRKEMMQEHDAIFEAIWERDSLMARLAARRHLNNIRKRYNQLEESARKL